jgi:hypothetical protein
MASRTQLISSLSAAGQEPLALRCGEGGALVLPHGARVIGLFARGCEENFLWTNPALGDGKSAETLYQSDDWHNSGGDRVWLAPEIDLFFPDYPNREVYLQPRSIDPGHWSVTDSKDGLTLANSARVQLFRHKREIEVEMTKRYSPAPDPLRLEKSLDLGDVRYVGYTQQVTLELLCGVGLVGLWNLLQLPHGGELAVMTYTKTEPTVVFGEIPARCISSDERTLRYRMNHAGDAKITIRAAAVTGRAGYLYSSGDQWSLVVRNFTVDPSGEYADPPWDTPDDLGYAVQACNVNGTFGQFSELEYHAPAIGGNTGRKTCQDTSQVWAYRGPERSVRAIADALLGPSSMSL